MNLCETCKTFSLVLLGGGSLYPAGVYHLGRKNPLFANARDLLISAERCRVCFFLKDLILSAVEWEAKNEDLSDIKDWLAPGPLYVMPCNDPPRGSGAFTNDQEHLTGFTLEVPVIEGGPKLNVLDLEADIFAEEGSPAATSLDIGSRPALLSSDCPEAFSSLNSWIATCVGTHKTCRKTISGAVIDEDIPPRLLTRVLDVRPAGEPLLLRLKISNGECGHYVALSHCWGPPEKRPLRTMTANIQDHTKAISPSALPKTFQDAVEVTRAIGLRYLWIDSLCIVQDDRDDWLRESQEMGLIYQYAQITVAASHARDGTEGLFLQRPDPPQSIEIPYINSSGEEHGSMFVQARGKNTETWSPDLGPLSKRAWITQEWLLSRRTVFYTRSRLIWACGALEGDLETHRIVRQRYIRGLKVSSSDDWEGIVNHYSGRLLTYATDKLVALQGIVNELQKKYPERVYAQGLWMSDFPRNFLWRGERPLSNTPSELNIPSWSWASKMGSVNLTTILPLESNVPDFDTGSRVCCGSMNILEDGRTLSIEAKIKVVGLSPRSFRPVLGDNFSEAILYQPETKEYLDIEWIQDVWLKDNMKRHYWTSPAGSHSFIFDFVDNVQPAVVGCAHIDVATNPQEPVFAALLMSSDLISRGGEEHGELPAEHVLVLEVVKTAEEGVRQFERIGEGVIKRCGTASFFEGREMEVIQII